MNLSGLMIESRRMFHRNASELNRRGTDESRPMKTDLRVTGGVVSGRSKFLVAHFLPVLVSDLMVL